MASRASIQAPSPLATALAASRPFVWERSYPAGVSWDTAIETMTLPELLDRAVARWGMLPALRYRAECLTYGELGRAVDRLAAGLASIDRPAGTPLALYLPNTVWHPVLLFAALKAGWPVVQLSPLDAERELAAKLADSGARSLATVDQPALLARAQDLLAAGRIDRLLVAVEGPNLAQTLRDGSAAMPPDGRSTIGIAALMRHQAVGKPLPAADDPDAVALLQYTGGTTGVAKAAMLSHANLTAAVSMGHAWARPQGLTRQGGGRIICALPLFHIYALTSILLRGLSNGSEIVILPRFDAGAVLDEIESGRAIAFAGVPTMWIALLAEPGIERRDLSSLINIACGGAPLPVEIQARVEALTGRSLLGGWGMTETCPAGTQIPPGRPDKRGTIGLPMPGLEMAIVALDDAGRRLGSGEAGEIVIRGPNVTRGYWRRPEETAAAFRDGWLLTGDIGMMDADGFFFLLDRKKDMIISGGFNVYPRQIEDALYEHPAIAEALVIAIPDDYRGEAAKAFITLRANQSAPTIDELRDFLSSRLGRHQLPAAVEVRAALPRTAIGKLSKKDLIAEVRSAAKTR